MKDLFKKYISIILFSKYYFTNVITIIIFSEVNLVALLGNGLQKENNIIYISLQSNNRI